MDTIDRMRLLCRIGTACAGSGDDVFAYLARNKNTVQSVVYVAQHCCYNTGYAFQLSHDGRVVSPSVSADIRYMTRDGWVTDSRPLWVGRRYKSALGCIERWVVGVGADVDLFSDMCACHYVAERRRVLDGVWPDVVHVRDVLSRVCRRRR